MLTSTTNDDSLTRELYQRLVADGYSVFYRPMSLLPGDRWDETVAHALQAATIVGVVISKGSAQEHYRNEDIIRAIGVAERVVPILLDGAKAPYGLARTQAIHGSENNVDGIMNELSRILPARPSSPGQRYVDSSHTVPAEEATHAKWLVASALLLVLTVLVTPLGGYAPLSRTPPLDSRLAYPRDASGTSLDGLGRRPIADLGKSSPQSDASQPKRDGHLSRRGDPTEAGRSTGALSRHGTSPQPSDGLVDTSRLVQVGQGAEILRQHPNQRPATHSPPESQPMPHPAKSSGRALSSSCNCIRGIAKRSKFAAHLWHIDPSGLEKPERGTLVLLSPSGADRDWECSVAPEGKLCTLSGRSASMPLPSDWADWSSECCAD